MMKLAALGTFLAFAVFAPKAEAEADESARLILSEGKVISVELVSHPESDQKSTWRFIVAYGDGLYTCQIKGVTYSAEAECWRVITIN